MNPCYTVYLSYTIQYGIRPPPLPSPPGARSLPGAATLFFFFSFELLCFIDGIDFDLLGRGLLRRVYIAVVVVLEEIDLLRRFRHLHFMA